MKQCILSSELLQFDNALEDVFESLENLAISEYASQKQILKRYKELASDRDCDPEIVEEYKQLCDYITSNNIDFVLID